MSRDSESGARDFEQWCFLMCFNCFLRLKCVIQCCTWPWLHIPHTQICHRIFRSKLEGNRHILGFQGFWAMSQFNRFLCSTFVIETLHLALTPHPSYPIFLSTSSGHGCKGIDVFLVSRDAENEWGIKQCAFWLISIVFANISTCSCASRIINLLKNLSERRPWGMERKFSNIGLSPPIKGCKFGRFVYLHLVSEEIDW